MGALHRFVEHLAHRSHQLRVGERFLEVIFPAEDEVDRHHARFRRDSGGVGGRRDDEIDIAAKDELEGLRLLAQLGARELIDDHCPLAEVLERIAENVGEDAVPGRMRLVVTETEMTRLLRRRGRERGKCEHPGKHAGPHRWFHSSPHAFVLIGGDHRIARR